MKTPARISEFTNDRARTRFHTVYQQALTDLGPPTPRPVTAPTTYGDVTAYRFGPTEGTPVVLLPGAGGNTLSWHHYIAALSTHHPVITLDLLGEPGASHQRTPITTTHDATDALHQALDSLGLTHPHLVGMSNGGWLALQHEHHHPGHAAGLTLIDPAGLGTISTRFLAWVIAGGLAALTPSPVRRRLAGPLGNATLRDDNLMKQVKVSLAFRRRLPGATPLTDDELAAVTAPTLVLLGARSQLYDASAVADRIHRVMPHARAEVIPDATHDLPTRFPDLVTDRISMFLTAGHR
ncbi:alpha/beta fold hydrolase [Actinoplanes sp. NPDC051494]|uniref:alpha/beta fold hydrolase n=1 Tax=Actinoplanes sp. NPDC051494 TaxID=3363907 RepID=UPI00378B2516